MLQAGRTDGEQTPSLPSIEDCCRQQDGAFKAESSDTAGMHAPTCTQLIGGDKPVAY